MIKISTCAKSRSVTSLVGSFSHTGVVSVITAQAFPFFSVNLKLSRQNITQFDSVLCNIMSIKIAANILSHVYLSKG